MPDIVDRAVRSRMMSSIRSKNTHQEVLVRKALHAKGFRYRLHRKDLPGTPDITFPRYRAVVFVHGCFWHGHDCHLFRWPSSNACKWKRKIRDNRTRDESAIQRLLSAGWRVCTIWECTLRGRSRRSLQDIADITGSWLLGMEQLCELRGMTDA